jgi:hypothetical protein
MKTVKLTIEVEVEEGSTHVAMDYDGAIYEYECEPEGGAYVRWVARGKFNRIVGIKNWKETLTEVK